MLQDLVDLRRNRWLPLRESERVNCEVIKETRIAIEGELLNFRTFEIITEMPKIIEQINRDNEEGNKNMKMLMEEHQGFKESLECLNKNMERLEKMTKEANFYIGIWLYAMFFILFLEVVIYFYGM